ncbi:hypothetical protein AB1Y20_017473 [Prymnesium parvum]|uniref:S1-like domain-containing protein n=1 Tax=Prymnesium parvum TaxID=97485 RepID=A0AB34JLW3_PRYPA
MGRGKRVNDMLEDLPEPTPTQQIVVVLGMAGGNMVNVQDAEGHEYLCRVPAKFRNVVWIKKGGHLIVERADGAMAAAEGKASDREQCTLAHFLYRDQIKHLQSRALWPASFTLNHRPQSETDACESGLEDLPGIHRNDNHRWRAQDRSLPSSSDEEG